MRVRELARFLGETFEGDGEKVIGGVAMLETAGLNDLSFVSNKKAAVQAQRSAAGCLLAPLDFPNDSGRTLIRAADPRTAFARCIVRMHPKTDPPPFIHPSADIAPSATIGEGVSIGPHATVGDQSRIGAGARIGAGCAIGGRVSIGEQAALHANVTVYDDVDIGDRSVLHSGCVIGADGFGFNMVGGRWEKFPQVGRVSIGSDVEIGANSTVDRAALGVTWIGDGTKIDNMVHIGHNCRVGKHVIIVAQTGFAGGVVIEDYATIGGQVGIGDKARVESRAVVGSGAGILTSKVVRAGQVMWGTPARPLREYLEQLANLARLPALRKEVLAMSKRLAALEGDRKD
jgi:UDP-3-O-[3-hydroxymyristoyl] glucosamine N-acyltransferase